MKFNDFMIAFKENAKQVFDSNQHLFVVEAEEICEPFRLRNADKPSTLWFGLQELWVNLSWGYSASHKKFRRELGRICRFPTLWSPPL